MEIKQYVSLRNFNTFGLESEARYFAEPQSVEELADLLRDTKYQQTPKFILSGGSNVLFSKDIDALVIHPQIKGTETIREDEEFVWLYVGGGEVWQDFVNYCVDHNYAGIENLSLIPGTVGAAPMQNIGAYGVEIKDVIETVYAISIATAETRIFSWEECQFGYRESIFKKELKDQYIITGAVFKLKKNPDFNIEYGDIKKTLAEMGVENLSIKAISDAVVRIRQSKLPDPAKIGNAGSFFKNPEIDLLQYELLKETFPEMPGYPVGPGKVKVPAGWLIERAGWKGYREGQIGVHERQALVLVNYGGGKGEDIKLLSEKIRRSIEEKFGIVLTTEVNFV
ncbi:UDP-N-acetylmuramate dehydrogenase [Dyadobacter psychrotolerans]|uniref:UDP-N-acetylenolpyruvoylglucosamine reductase n=1 Tax=Dyadobacter psychrotolerans TaxID=2541721 RepID=A0A4R5DHK2_9BACT|nr:UDP-N-acetylmuramate dehydrogenase [Dyadobacter psychrotolerans]TDE09973.1 UDP-N-acetylmuramate dehydrogenase [Dyadobacter psychrotolerans]